MNIQNMKAVIFAGGFGTRIAEESAIRPKPMIEVGGKPILWHIMKIYHTQGVKDFIICCGYKSNIVKDYFANYAIHNSDVTFNTKENTLTVHNNTSEDWKVTLAETGVTTAKGGRLLAIKKYLGNEPFFLTYGDGVCNIDLQKLLSFHNDNGALVTLTAVQPPGRFGGFILHEDQTKISSFKEKPKGDGAWINGGYFVVDPKALDYITEASQEWEEEPMQKLAQDNKLAAYKHDGFWQNMDTLHDKQVLEQMWQGGSPHWKKW